MRWHQVGDYTERVLLAVPQPLVVETYYQCCLTIDGHNRCRQDDVRLENNIVT